MMNITIDVPEDEVRNGNARKYLDKALSALGYHRGAFMSATLSDSDLEELRAAGPVGLVVEPEPQKFPEGPSEIDEAEAAGAEPVEPFRARGTPSGDRKRRTKVEIAEDDHLEALAAKANVPLDFLDEKMAEVQDRAQVIASLETRIARGGVDATPEPAEQAQISSGGERVGPEDAQDAADEAAQTADASTGAPTHDDLRKALGTYTKVHGMKAATDAVKEGGLIGCTIDKVPEDQIGSVIAKLGGEAAAPAAAGGAGLFGGEEAAPEPEPATMEDVMKALGDYGEKFDGTRDMTKIFIAKEDCAPVLVEIGGTAKLLEMDPKHFRAIVDRITEMVATNPKGREVKG